MSRGMWLVFAVLSSFGCDSAEKNAEPLDALALCAAQVDEASCNAAEPESDALVTTCEWVEWTRVELDETT